MWFSHPAARVFSDLQFTCGEGPSVDSAHYCSVVRVDNLSTVREDRWPALTATDTGPVKAIFCFPLRIGALRIGVLTLTRASPGSLTGDDNQDAHLLAQALTRYCLNRSPPPSGTSEEDPAHPHPGGDPPGFLEANDPLERAEIHQATGMLSVQLRTGLGDALVLLRAHAYTSGMPLDEVAHAVITHRLSLGDRPHDNDTPDEKDPPI
nr:ANTAR domain-containing protein [Streptomyces sp. SID14478]